MTRVNREKEFIIKSKSIHGNKYDYSLVEYQRTNERVKIICPKHGVFEQRPMEHLNGHGCQECGHESMFREEYKDGKRRCSKCGEYLDLSCFHKDKIVSDGLSSRCKKCHKKLSDDWKRRNIDYVIKKRTEWDKRRWAKYKEEHKTEFEQRAEERRLKSIENKKLDKMGRKIRSRIRDAVKNGIYRPHMKELIGCSLEFFKSYIESLWQDGMSWDNYNYYGWHLDHIKPIASFNLHNVEEQKECFHYTNHQPMWRKPNQLKGAKYNGKDYHKPNRK